MHMHTAMHPTVELPEAVAELADDAQETFEDVPVQLVGSGTWQTARTAQDDRSRSIISPTAHDDAAAAEDARHTAQLSVLLSGKPGKSLPAPTSPKPGLSLGLLGPSSGKAHQAQPTAGIDAAHAATVLKRLSLASMGLLAAPDAGLLPGNPLTEPHMAGSAGVLAWGAGQSWGQVGPAASTAQPSKNWLNQPGHSLGQGSIGARDNASLLSLQQGSSQLRGSSSGGAAAAASVKPGDLSSKAVFSRQKDSTSEGTPGSSNRTSATALGSEAAQQGTAAFKASTRTKANQAGRFTTVAQADIPGPGQFRPLHTVVDKHVRGVSLGPATSSRGTAAARTIKPMAAGAVGITGATSMAASQGLDRQQHGRCSQDASACAAYRASTGHRLSAAATEGGRRGSICTVGTTPRSAADEHVTDVPHADAAQAGAKQDKQQLQQQQRQQGTAAFKAVSRNQRAAVAAGRPYVNANSSEADQCLQREQDCSPEPVRQVSHAPEFSKQTYRPPPSVPSSSPAALGPGAYFRRGALPASLTGKSLLAGHDPTAAATDFGRASSRPGSSAAVGRSSLRPATAAVHGGLLDELAGQCAGRPGSAMQFAGQLVDGPGMWGWAADDRTCCSAAQQQHHQHQHGVVGGDALQYVGPGQQVQQNSSRPSSGVMTCTRPSSAALSYARVQRGTVLVAPAADADGDAWLMDDQPLLALPGPEQATGSCSNIQHQQQQGVGHLQRPCSVGPQQAVAIRFAGRPLSAGPLLSGAQPRPYSSSRHAATQPRSPSRSISTAVQQGQQGRSAVRTAPAQQRPVRGNNSSGTDGLGVEEMERYSSTGFAPRVKGGKFSASGKDSAAVAAPAAANELLYEPQPEVQGHMRRAPGWSLPPNYVATSKKWAQMAAQAALQ